MAPFSPLRHARAEEENAIPLVAQAETRPSDVGKGGRYASTIRETTPRSPHNRPKHAESPGPRLLRKWWAELLCCVLVVGALLAVVATVYPFSGKPLPQWPYGLSINTLVSIYITTLKVAMLFVVTQGLGQLKWGWFKRTRPLLDLAKYDDATRGSWGAISLLWSLGRRTTFVTFIGAFVVILAMVIDPFGQQIVHYYACVEVAPESVASIPKVNSYTDPLAFHNGAGSVSLGVGTQAAASAGAFSASAFSLLFNCPTGNCTFEQPYWSVGYCSSCSDISSELRTVNYTYAVQYGADNVTRWTTNDTLPSGLYTSLWDSGAMFAMGGYMDQESSRYMPKATIEAIYAPGSKKPSLCGSDNTWACKGYGAARCELSPCLRGYTAKVQGGFLHETFQDSTSNWVHVPGTCLNNVDLGCVTASQKLSLRQAGYRFNDTAKWLPYNVTVFEVSATDGLIGWPSAGPGLIYYSAYPPASQQYTNATLSIVPAQCIYSYDIAAATALAKWLAGFFNGTVHSAPEALWVSPDPGPSAMLLNIWNEGNVSLSSLNATLANITDSITTYMRQNGVTRLSSPALGATLYNNTCVQIQWAWLTFPATLVLLMLLFFALMIYGTWWTGHGVGDQDFKSSVLPLMFHGLYDDGQDPSSDSIGTVDQMSSDAKHMLVALSLTERGWRFVEVNQDRRAL